MPVMDGYELTRNIRKQERERSLPHMPLLGCTAHVQERERRLALDVGMDECLMKPLSIDVLQEALLRYLPVVPGDVPEARVRPAVHERAAQPPAVVAPPPATTMATAPVSAAPFDPQLLRDFSAGNVKMEIGFLQALIQSNVGDIANLERHVFAGEHAEAASCSHKIRGAARIIRADRVVRDCEILELAASQSAEPEVMQSSLVALQRSLAEFDAAMLAHIESYGALAN